MPPGNVSRWFRAVGRKRRELPKPILRLELDGDSITALNDLSCAEEATGCNATIHPREVDGETKSYFGALKLASETIEAAAELAITAVVAAQASGRLYFKDRVLEVDLDTTSEELVREYQAPAWPAGSRSALPPATDSR